MPNRLRPVRSEDSTALTISPRSFCGQTHRPSVEMESARSGLFLRHPAQPIARHIATATDLPMLEDNIRYTIGAEFAALHPAVSTAGRGEFI